MSRPHSVLAALVAAIACATGASAGSFFIGGLPAPGASASTLSNGQRVSRPVGYAVIGGAEHAGQWRFSANNPAVFTWLDLHPAGASSSRAHAAHRARIAGEATFGASTNAMVWRVINSVESLRNLNPDAATQSAALDMRRTLSGQRTVGWAEIGGAAHASLWRAKADTWIDLNPLAATASTAIAHHDGQQAGWAEIGGQTHASVWTGTAASWIDLNPVGATSSMALGAQNGRQIGWAEFGGVMQAGTWLGAAASWTSLNAAGADASAATDGNARGSVVGWAEFGGDRHAARWSPGGTFFDLHAMLPGDFQWSEAIGTWSRGHTQFIAGMGLNNNSGMVEALYWQLPAPGATGLFGLAGLVGARRRRAPLRSPF